MRLGLAFVGGCGCRRLVSRILFKDTTNFHQLRVIKINIARLPRQSQIIGRDWISDNFPNSPANLSKLYPLSFCSHR
jgi:hypothetical protein